ncbi:MAG: N-acetylmuramoyl-L-alanine amidase [Alphaproteobacteria bacterium]|nr:N-acetylmuramoyl-L-alanine amidase [Alphaproteobacteria bacterium]OJV16026.1 MAG: hypothetical protein BGO27_04170 [Alphaproteobacteria bacterium 33-17]
MVNIITKYKSENFNDRKGDFIIDTIVIHYTVTDFATSLKLLTQSKYGVSSHFLVNTNGDVYNLVDTEKRAWHAGKSYWRGNTDVNSNSIGIEIVNDGYSEFTDDQISSVLELCQMLKEKYQAIEDRNIIGHSDVAIGRKIDPGKYFPWQYFAENGVGVWANIDKDQSEPLYYIGDKDDKILEIKEKLSDYGYQITNFDDTYDLELKKVLYAFQLHFDPENATGNIDNNTIAIIDSIYYL